MFWGDKVEITEKNTMKPHNHEMWELVVCLSDTGRHIVGSKTYGFKTGRTFLLPSGVPHQAIGEVSAPGIMLYLCFDMRTDLQNLPSAVTTLLRDAKKRGLHASKAGMEATENVALATSIEQELNEKKLLSQTMIGTLLSHLLANHFRSFGMDDTEKEGASARIAVLLDRIGSDIKQSISLNTAAKSTGMSRSLFTREFRRNTGTSFVEYVNSIRIGHAIDLLTTTRKTISEVASECGYENLGYFHRMFKRHTNSTPLKLRRLAIETGHPPLK